jgi:transposase-like protein
MQCRKCGAEATVKNGFMAGIQRYKCKNCSFQFTGETAHGNPMKDKILALILYLSGLSMNMTAKIIGVSAQTVMRWIRLFYDRFANPAQSTLWQAHRVEMW